MTLIELLAVIAILGVLSSVLFASAKDVIESGRTAKCLSNLRQIGIAAHLYADDNEGRLPSSSHHRGPDGESLSWIHTLEGYLGRDFLGRCPSVPDHPARITYAINDLLTDIQGKGILATSTRTPSATILVAETTPTYSSEHFHFRGAARGRVSAALFRSSVHVECHGSSANYLFVDGHVQTVSWSEVQRRLAETEQTIIQP